MVKKKQIGDLQKLSVILLALMGIGYIFFALFAPQEVIVNLSPKLLMIGVGLLLYWSVQSKED